MSGALAGRTVVGDLRSGPAPVDPGAPLLEASDGLEAVYAGLLELETVILEAMQFRVIQAGMVEGASLRTEHISESRQ